MATTADAVEGEATTASTTPTTSKRTLPTLPNDIFILIVEYIDALKIPKLMLVSKSLRNKVQENIVPISTSRIKQHRNLLQKTASALDFSSTTIISAIKTYVTTFEEYDPGGNGYRPNWADHFASYYASQTLPLVRLKKSPGKKLLTLVVEALYLSHLLDEDQVKKKKSAFEAMYIRTDWARSEYIKKVTDDGERVLGDVPLSKFVEDDRVEVWGAFSDRLPSEVVREMFEAVRSDPHVLVWPRPSTGRTLTVFRMQKSSWKRHQSEFWAKGGGHEIFDDVPELPSTELKYRITRHDGLQKALWAARTFPAAKDEILTPLVKAALWEGIGIVQLVPEQKSR